MSIKDTFSDIVETVKEKIGMEREEAEVEFSEEDEREHVFAERTGELKREFIAALNDNFKARVEAQDSRPMVENWPYDDFTQWASAHRDKARHVICNTIELRDSPFCGSGYH
jgi:hypothetical protein